jgi:hypothetical protein
MEKEERRPYPPVNFTGENWLPYTRIIPATEIGEWVNRHILSGEGRLHNPDHEHLTNALADADIAFMWASSAFAKKGRTVLGQCEEVMMRAGGWQKARMEQQMHEWFGRIPKYIITLAADYCEQCNDLEFCALVEHELYHIAQATDDLARRSSTKRPDSQCLNCAATTSKSSLAWFVVMVQAATYRNWWMQQINLRRLHISMLPERAGRAC